MRVLTNLTLDEMHDAREVLPHAVFVEITEHRSRKRDRGFEVRLCAEPGKDKRGNPRRWANSGVSGADTQTKAATWYEWGDYFAEIFRRDPRAIIGYDYDGVADYVEQTARFNPDGSGTSPWADLTESRGPVCARCGHVHPTDKQPTRETFQGAAEFYCDYCEMFWQDFWQGEPVG